MNLRSFWLIFFWPLHIKKTWTHPFYHLQGMIKHWSMNEFVVLLKNHILYAQINLKSIWIFMFPIFLGETHHLSGEFHHWKSLKIPHRKDSKRLKSLSSISLVFLLWLNHLKFPYVSPIVWSKSIIFMAQKPWRITLPHLKIQKGTPFNWFNCSKSEFFNFFCVKTPRFSAFLGGELHGVVAGFRVPRRSGSGPGCAAARGGAAGAGRPARRSGAAPGKMVETGKLLLYNVGPPR